METIPRPSSLKRRLKLYQSYFIRRVVGRNILNGHRTYKFDVLCGQQKFDVQITGDRHFLVILGNEKMKSKECIYVYHAKKGIFLHKILLKYPQYKRPNNFKTYSDFMVLVLDTEKANIIDVRNKMFVRSISRWTGQVSPDGRYGLAAPNSGGLLYLDLRSGKVVKNLIERLSEGVFTVICSFSKCGRYIIYYHNGRRTIRLYRRDCPSDEMRPLANFCLHTEATSIKTTEDGKKLVVGGTDGSVTILVICEIGEEQRQKTIKFLKSLPSRQARRGGSVEGGSACSDLSEDERRKLRAENVALEKRKRNLRRFRAVARVALYLDRFIRRHKQQSVGRAFRKVSTKDQCRMA